MEHGGLFTNKKRKMYNGRTKGEENKHIKSHSMSLEPEYYDKLKLT